jgi:hypothetical protein
MGGENINSKTLSSTETSTSSSSPSLPSGVPVWKAFSIFITLDILIWLAVRRFSLPKRSTTTRERFQQDFVSWSKMAYEQQQASRSSGGATNQQRANPMNFQHPSPRVIDRHLDVLGIPKAIGVLPKESEIKDAYRKICLKTHPDVLGSDHPEKQQAEKKFIEATTSYNYLLDYLKK